MERNVEQALKELETWDKERLREETEFSACSQEIAKKEVEQLGRLHEIDSIEPMPLELNSVQETLGFLSLPLVSITTVVMYHSRCTLYGNVVPGQQAFHVSAPATRLGWSACCSLGIM